VTRAGFDRAVVVIPAHNEATRLPRCLTAVLAAATAMPGRVLTVVVLDACTDRSTDVADRFGPAVQVLSIDAHNVGAARAAGFNRARTVRPDANVARTWYATTDADSRVDPDWLVRQMVADVDMVLGVVRVAYWRHVPSSVAGRYRYRSKSASDEGHNHVHGANMGSVAETYWEVGGFAALPSSKDVDLVRRFEQRSYHIRRDANLSVVTSARYDGRAPNGFAAPAVHAAPTWCRGSGVTTPLVRQWLDAGELNLPLPASGDTVGRWLKRGELTEVDVVAGRLAELTPTRSRSSPY
jgi:glycosyltransferase involved in cell wall biosynthesis